MDIVLQGSYGPPDASPNLLRRLMNVAKAAEDVLWLDSNKLLYETLHLDLQKALEDLENYNDSN